MALVAAGHGRAVDVMAASLRPSRDGALRFFGRGGRVVLRAEPQGDGWWWFDADAGGAIAAVGQGRGRLHDLDLAVVAEVGADGLEVAGRTWPVDGERRVVGPAREPVVSVALGDGLLVVRHRPEVDRPTAALVALALRHPAPLVPVASASRRDDEDRVWNDPNAVDVVGEVAVRGARLLVEVFQ